MSSVTTKEEKMKEIDELFEFMQNLFTNDIQYWMNNVKNLAIKVRDYPDDYLNWDLVMSLGRVAMVVSRLNDFWLCPYDLSQEKQWLNTAVETIYGKLAKGTEDRPGQEVLSFEPLSMLALQKEVPFPFDKAELDLKESYGLPGEDVPDLALEGSQNEDE